MATIPMLDLKRQLSTIRREIDEAISRVIDSTRFILGPEVESFENNLAQYCGANYAIGCASGSDALLISLYAAGVKPGDRVVTTAYSFFATAGAILRLGAIPVFVDIDRDTFNLDCVQLRKTMEYHPSAVIPVHMFGQMCDMETIKEIAGEIPVIEDAAQAVGATWNGKSIGAYGTAACLSFFPAKNLGAFGDGGAIVTNDRRFADVCRMLRAHGARETYHHERLGMNSRLDAIQAAVLNVKLKHLDQWISLRQRNAEHYDALLENTCIRTPVIVPGAVGVYNQYTIQVNNRDELQRHLAECGIESTVYYPVPLPEQPCFNSYSKLAGYPVAKLASQSCLSIPVFPEITRLEQELIAEHILAVANLREQ